MSADFKGVPKMHDRLPRSAMVPLDLPNDIPFLSIAPILVPLFAILEVLVDGYSKLTRTSRYGYE